MFRQIFESSIAENYSIRHIFMDLVVLADFKDGTVDMTREAIARITNVPLEEVCAAIEELERPDSKSRNPTEDGRRLIRMDEHRDWGWVIVNYEQYRNMRDEEARRAYFRERKREQREREKSQTLSNDVLDSQTLSNDVTQEKKKEIEKEKKREEETEEKGRSFALTSEPIRASAGDSDLSKPKPRKTPLMTNEKLKELATDPAYDGLDVRKEAFKFNQWCEANGKTKSVRRFVNWLNRIS